MLESERVAKYFDEFEAEGYNKTFQSPYEQYRERIGESFTVIGRVTNAEADSECLPMWKIQFADGFVTDAWPEEIIPSATYHRSKRE